MKWPQPNSLAVYIHWPFCIKKCPYCDFAVTVRRNPDTNIVMQGLIKNLMDQAQQLPIQPKVHSIFFGGGTPSLMSAQDIERFINTIEQLFGLTSDCEISLEANPTDAETKKFLDFQQAGINRLSLGVQSLEDTELVILGRNHSANDARHALDITAQTFDNFSLDLMYALPHQHIENWPNRVNELLNWQPKHVSLYQLTIEPDTVFDKAVQRGILQPFDDDLAADIYIETATLLTQSGLPAYEVSNHAKANYKSRHNLSYWRYQDYIGIGPGAHGRLTINGQKHQTLYPKLLAEWQKVERVNIIPLSAQTADEEAFLMSMRTQEGAIIGDTIQINQDKLALLTKQGMLSYSGNSFHPTPEGWLRLDSMTGMLLT